MAVYRQINITFWQDDFVLELTPEEKFFYLYLMTNSKTSQCGIYELPKKIIQFETGYNGDTVEKLIQKFIDYRKILYCDETKEVMLLNWVKYNNSTSPKVLKCIENEIKEVKNKEFLNTFITLCKQYGYSIDTVQIPERNKNKNKNKNKNNNNNNNNKESKKESDTSVTFNEILFSYTSNPSLLKALQEYVKMRQRIRKPLTNYALELALKKLDSLAVDDGIKISILEQSITNSWQGLFPLKGKANKNHTEGLSKWD